MRWLLIILVNSVLRSSFGSSGDSAIIEATCDTDAFSWRISSSVISITGEISGCHPDAYCQATDGSGSGSGRCVCKDGFEGDGLSCELPTCMALDSTIQHGYSTAIQGQLYERGSTVYFSCDPGYMLTGKAWTVCMYFKTFGFSRWSHPTPMCREARCPIPAVPENANYLGKPPYFPGDQIQFRCHSGYQMVGSSVRICLEDGKWSGRLTICESGVGYCTDLGIPINGNKNGNSYRQGDTINFRCNHGYGLVGSSARTCLVTREWSGTMPTCRGNNEFDSILETAVILGNILGKFSDEIQLNQTRFRKLPDAEDAMDGRMEIYFVFDGSASVGKDNFDIWIGFAMALVEEVHTSSNPLGPYYGAIVYSNTADVKFHISDLFTITEIKEKLRTIEYPQTGGSGIGLGLRAVRTSMIPFAMQHFGDADNIRVPTKRVIFLTSDGRSNVGGSPINEAKQLKEEYDVEIFVIGVGFDADTNEISEIASSGNPEKHVFILKNFVELNKVATHLGDNEVDYSECGIAGNLQPETGRHTDANDRAWPWQAILWPTVGSTIKTNNPFCSGSLISDQWVLTAAHCFSSIEQPIIDHFFVGLGITDLKSDMARQTTMLMKVTKVIIHHEFNGVDNDIALLRLEKKVVLSSYVRTVCLPDKTNATHLLQKKAYVITTGWGINQNKTIKYKHLQQAHNVVCRKKHCLQVQRYQESLATFNSGGVDLFCIRNKFEFGCTRGDPGSPVVTKILTSHGRLAHWVQVGLGTDALLNNCNEYGHHRDFFLYTDITTFSNWISTETGIQVGA